MIIYGLKPCDTCRKARKALPAATFVDVREEGLPGEVLDRALALFGDKLVNTRSTTWRDFDEDTRAMDPAALIAAHPTVMKRPLFVEDQRMVLGWDKAAQSALGAV